ncbi:MAG TPA: hypothetical protein VHD33_05520, partial [Legionellaceae bacterium]|nr:hypothetical protein [Legionellaceae bacterium]
NAGSIKPYVPVTASPDKMARLLNTVQQVRTTLQNASKTILAIGGDIDASLFTPLRELTLVAKDALSIPFSVADMANNVINSMRSAIVDLASTKDAATNFRANINRAFGTVSRNANTITDDMTALAAEQHDAAFVIPGKDAAPANNPFLDPVSNYDFFSGISIGDLNLPPTVLSAVAQERQRVRNLTRLDYQNRRDAVQAVVDNYANAVGLGGTTYNQIYGIQAPPTPVVDKPTDDDYNVLYALNSLLIEMSRLVVSTTTNTNTKLDSIASIAGMATASGMAFQIPVSKFPIPFPYGATMEGLATKYLGSPDRAIEIIALNGLQSPYVDEVGFELPLLSNGVGNTLFVGSAEHLFIGQPVWISSTTVNRMQTRITGIRVLNNSQVMVTVAADVSNYTTMAKATLLAYLPNTVNSQQTIYIPSQTEPQQNDLTLRNVPGIDQYDPLLAVGGIDLLLTPEGDLVLDKYGDTKWAVGLTNCIQSLKLAMNTPRGALNRHPEYGLDLQPGVSLADLDATQIAAGLSSMIADNPAFSGIDSAKVAINGPVADLSIAIKLNPTDQLLPLNLQINRN